MTAATVPGIDDAPTENARLLSWVREVAELTTPDRIVWCDGSEEEWERVTTTPRRGGHLRPAHGEAELVLGRLRPRRRRAGRGAHLHLLVAGVRRRRHQQLVDPAEMKAMMTELYRGCMRGRTMYVIPFCMGPHDRREADARRGDHRLRVRRRVDADHDADGRRGAAAVRRPGRRRLRPRAALDRRPARAGPAGRRLAVQHDQVHRALPRGAADLELRLRLRRQRAAGQEVLLAADRLGDGPRRGLARRAHADPQADQPGEEGVLRRRGVPVRVRQDQPRDARSRPSPAGRSRPSATTSRGCASATTAGSTR